MALFFPDSKESAFANYHTWKAVGFTVTFVYSSFLCVATKLIIAISLLVLAMVLYVIVELRVTRYQRRGVSKPESTHNGHFDT